MKLEQENHDCDVRIFIIILQDLNIFVKNDKNFNTDTKAKTRGGSVKRSVNIELHINFLMILIYIRIKLIRAHEL